MGELLVSGRVTKTFHPCFPGFHGHDVYQLGSSTREDVGYELCMLYTWYGRLFCNVV